MIPMTPPEGISLSNPTDTPLSSWAARLACQGMEDFTHLTWVFGSPELTVFHYPGAGWFLRSTRFRNEATRDELQEEVEKIVGLLNGYSQLIWPGCRPVEAMTMVRFQADGTPVEGGIILAKPQMFILVGDDGEGIAEILGRQ